LPPEAVNIEKKLRAIGLGAEVDKVIVTMNEGAESAVAEAKPIFVNAITQMSFQDAMGILTGGKGSATNYLRNSTTTALIEAFKPKVQVALDKVGFTKNWSDLVNTYNKIPTVQKLNPDLNGYITGQAVTALFQQVEIEENNIRDNPAARGTALLKKVFSYADTKKTN
ncbi:MAG: DUF4197 domain-containing protein, partial [Bacteroidia bacterium]|nr:DUF4197 domain-containing protein [Bacteroidia bacterium]